MGERQVNFKTVLSALAVVVAVTAPVSAADFSQAVSLPAPRDEAYPGAIKLHVDATNTEQRIFKIRASIPTSPGPMTLLFPQWLPANHAPRGPIDKLAGLIVKAGGQRVEWRRDPVEVYAFHIDVPAGATSVDLEYQYLSPTAGDQGRIVVTPEMLNLQWNTVVLYPAGYYARRIPVEASVKLPDGWQMGTALETASASGSETTFKPVSLEVLVDSPIFAGRHFSRIDLDPKGRSRVTLNIMADEAEQLEAKPEYIAAHRNLVKQADLLFGARHYDHYDFLLALSDKMGGIGLEHHRSSENGTSAKYFTEWDKRFPGRDLLAHEYSHSWNGKFRRPADLWTPNYNVPMRDSLLWLYEGQTQYWGYVLAARSGLWTKQQALDALAATAALYDHRVGRAWKPLQDTTNDPITSARRPQPWSSWQRSEDYYSEGLLVWLDVDTVLRERTNGRRSLDDFARAFFGRQDGEWEKQASYTIEDVVAVLNELAPNDWSAFLRQRLDGHGPGAPLDGIARGGYRLVYTEEPTDLFKTLEAQRRVVDLSYSLGASVESDGRLASVVWDGALFKMGLAIGARIVAVNGKAYDNDRMKAAVKDSKDAKKVELIVRVGDDVRTLTVDYSGGLRYPRLERVEKTPARFDDIVTAKK
ncbi:MAG: M61 family metallopeptidase [Rhodospirillaceae bacterium]|nr:M61 family metallopeptidase [Rhodospirillaceae bacterium]